MGYQWLRVQMLGGAEAQRPEQKSTAPQRQHEGQDDEQRPRAAVSAEANMRFVDLNRRVYPVCRTFEVSHI